MKIKFYSFILLLIFITSVFAGCSIGVDNSDNSSDISTPNSNSSNLNENQNSLPQNPEQGDNIVDSDVFVPTDNDASNNTENKNDNIQNTIPDNNQSNNNNNGDNNSNDNIDNGDNNDNNDDNNTDHEIVPPQPDLTTTYEAYIAMTSNEQLAFFNKFSNVEAFFEWYNDAKAEYEKNHPDKELGDGPIELWRLN